jgi:hypothetical protein
MNKWIWILVAFWLMPVLLNAQTEKKRILTKEEVQFLGNKVDSIRKNLNRMIIYEKELRQRNYFLNEKTGMVDELIATVQYLQSSVDVIDLGVSDIKKIFHKPSVLLPNQMIYSIETYKSNCPFMEITFHVKDKHVVKVLYMITECQKWK